MLRRRLGAISDGGHDVSKHGACFGPSSSSGPHTYHTCNGAVGNETGKVSQGCTGENLGYQAVSFGKSRLFSLAII